MYPFFIALVYALSYFVAVPTSVSAWTNNLTHVFALPAILYRKSGRSSGRSEFFGKLTFVTTVISVAFHASDTFGYDGDWLRRLDHGFSVMLMFASIAGVWYQEGFKVPSSVYVLILVSGVLPAAFLTKPRVYPPMAAFALLLATIIVFKRRDILYGYFMFLLSFVIRLLPTDNKEQSHSIWHAFAFTAVYYAIRYHYERFDKQTAFPRWIFYVFFVYMVLFLSYLSLDVSMPVSVPEGRCGVLHCGACGACSNLEDKYVYGNTSLTLTDDARSCAIWGTFGQDEQECLEKTGLSSNCTSCWVDNIACTRSQCLYPCLWEIVHPVKNSRCFACDERRCGAAFLECAGMNRRRAGVRTDISRSEEEVCDIKV